MNKQYAEKIISALKDDLENDFKGFELIDDMSRAEKLFGKEIPEICDCLDEARSYSGTIHRNAEIIIDLLQMKMAEQVGVGMTQIEQGLFIKLFNRGGYVLNFSTSEFDTFTKASVGVAVCSKYQLSKGKSLLAYIEAAKESDVNKLLQDLFDYYEEHFESEYVFTDGYAEKSVERRFAEDLDAADEVCVYAKLPRGFHIPTPVGNYSPDWAIAFNEGTVKHIFFIAETKGTMESLSLKPIEKAKISCARKLFNEISTENVKYHDVDNYQHLLDVMKSIK